MPAVSTVTTRAAILREVDAPQRVVDIELGPLGPTDVIVQMRAVGIIDGRLELEPLLGSRYPQEAIDDAVAEATTAVGGRVVLLPNGADA